MLVSDNSYGIANLAGPQIFLSLLPPAGAAKDWFAYFKFAPLMSGLSDFSLSHNELAAGGSYPIGKVKDRFPLRATLDLDRVSTTSPDGTQSFSLFSVTSGVQIGF